MPFEVERCIVGTVNYLPFLYKIRERRRVCVTDGCIFDEKNGNWSGFLAHARDTEQRFRVSFSLGRDWRTHSSKRERELRNGKEETVIPSDSV